VTIARSVRRGRPVSSTRSWSAPVPPDWCRAGADRARPQGSDHRLARLRASVRRNIERCFRDGTIVPLLGTEVVSIAERQVTLRTSDGLREMVNDRVIVQIGGHPPSELLRTTGIELVEKRGEA
jgi:hypothetical protein